MFAQVIQGRCRDKAACESQMDKWDRELKPGAEGFLGSTAGVSDEGTFVAIARFESQDAARRNSDRPEQGQWWQEMSQHLDPEVSFRDCPNVDTLLGGGSDGAGFVQIIQGRVVDVDKARSLSQEMEATLRERRPDLIGVSIAWTPDGQFTQAAYFKSEAEAREGERNTEGPPEEWASLFQDVTFIDLKEPRLSSR